MPAILETITKPMAHWARRLDLMTWLWISSIVVMVGAGINAEVEREAKGDAPAAVEDSAKNKIIASPHECPLLVRIDALTSRIYSR